MPLNTFYLLTALHVSALTLQIMTRERSTTASVQAFTSTCTSYIFL